MNVHPAQVQKTTFSDDRRHSGNDAPPSRQVHRERIPPSYGHPLAANDYEELEKSWITRELADAAMLRRVDSDQGRQIVGQKGSRDCAGILIPYYWPGDPHVFNYRLRRDHPELKLDSKGKLKPDAKYLAAPKGANRLYVPHGVTLDSLEGTELPIVITEGEKKALALQRLATCDVEQPRFIPVAISGVWNWRGTIGKTGGQNGERIDVKGPIPDLSRVTWRDRQVFVVFDTNVHENESVQWARKGIARELTGRGARVQLVTLPPDCGVNGVDDLLALWGPARVLELFQKTDHVPPVAVVVPPQFESSAEGMFRVTNRGDKSTRIKVSTYVARIKTSILLDDGVETWLDFEIEAEVFGRTYTLTVPASTFAEMKWPLERLGPQAITLPNQREYARAAIQFFSLEADERRLYVHTGWRNLSGRWLFLHGGGAIDQSGEASGIEVRLAIALNRYKLQPPSDPASLRAAVQAGLALVELGPPTVSFPLRAATCRAVLGGADFSIHLAGETGAFKSELAALEQQHFGCEMHSRNLPGSWSSTGNALEALAFDAKDTLLVIDDFAPQGSSADVARYHAAADRVFRAVGNHSGRGRLDSTARLREPKCPRALVLSTGEDVPRGHSVRARLLILEISKDAIDTGKLTECQKQARDGVYAIAMGGFIQWIAGHYTEVQAKLIRTVAELRQAAATTGSHARTPDIAANLQAAFELYLHFALDCDAITPLERDSLANRCWNALRQAASAQAKHHEASEPTARFVELIRSVLSSGRAHLEARSGGAPARAPGSCGWVNSSGNWSRQGDCIGWVQDDDLYLDPDAAYRVVQLACRDVGESLPVTLAVLKKRLHEKQLLASVESTRETLTVRKTIQGSSKKVLHFARHVLLPDETMTDSDEASCEHLH